MEESTLVLLASGIGGLVPLAALIFRLSGQADAAARQIITRNPWTWVWHTLILPGLAVGYATSHNALGSLDPAAAFELGAGIPLIVTQALGRLSALGSKESSA